MRRAYMRIADEHLPYLARLNADGSMDRTFNVPTVALPHVPQAIYPQYDGTLLAAVAYHGLYRLLPDGSRDASFTGNGVDGTSAVVGIRIRKLGPDVWLRFGRWSTFRAIRPRRRAT